MLTPVALCWCSAGETPETTSRWCAAILLGVGLFMSGFAFVWVMERLEGERIVYQWKCARWAWRLMGDIHFISSAVQMRMRMRYKREVDMRKTWLRKVCMWSLKCGWERYLRCRFLFLKAFKDGVPENRGFEPLLCELWLVGWSVVGSLLVWGFFPARRGSALVGRPGKGGTYSSGWLSVCRFVFFEEDAVASLGVILELVRVKRWTRWGVVVVFQMLEGLMEGGRRRKW